MLACWHGKAEFAAELISRGASVNWRDDLGGTALLYSLHDAKLVELLLDAGAHTHYRFHGPESTDTGGPGTRKLVPGTALENATRHGDRVVVSLLKQHEATSQSRDVHHLEQDTLMRILASGMLAHRAELGDDHAAERIAWAQQQIHDAFADPEDVAALSSRFTSVDGLDRLDLDLWSAVAKVEADGLMSHPRFEEAVEAVSMQLPGLHEKLHHSTGIV